MTNRFVVVLRLGRMSVVHKLQKARFIAESMNGNAGFPAPSPSLAEITAAANALEAAFIEAEGGGKEANAVMHEKEAELVRLLTEEGHYVERIANASPEEGASVILGAGMDYKRVHVRKPSSFYARHTALPGEVKLRTAYIDRAAFIWQYSTNPDGEHSWTNAAMTNKASTVISDLTVGVRYFFRVAVVRGNVQGEWSNAVSLVVV